MALQTVQEGEAVQRRDYNCEWRMRLFCVILDKNKEHGCGMQEIPPEGRDDGEEVGKGNDRHGEHTRAEVGYRILAQADRWVNGKTPSFPLFKGKARRPDPKKARPTSEI